jgi:ferredoxin, 2Fe-2S
LITLTGRTRTKAVEPQAGHSLLDLALKADVDWQYNCSRGTCARCRCQIVEGANQLREPTDEEWDRLGPEELDAGFRLGCQALVNGLGRITAVNKTYF